jgi:hypothetical protein
MIALKPLSREAVPAALEKAERYRLLNEPGEAESICLDVLDTDPDNQPARVMLVLALTDQFGVRPGAGHRAEEVLADIRDDYEREYYRGIVAERRAKAQLTRGGPGGAIGAYEWLTEAMDSYERAEAIRPSGNDDAILRWNACARLLMQHPQLRAAPDDRRELEMLE